MVMGNLSLCRVKGVVEAIEAAGGKCLYLPPYSPDFNPIEQAFTCAVEGAILQRVRIPPGNCRSSR